MKEPKKNATNSLETLQKLGRKYGVQVTDMAERGIKAIGILGGVRRQRLESLAKKASHDEAEIASCSPADSRTAKP